MRLGRAWIVGLILGPLIGAGCSSRDTVPDDGPVVRKADLPSYEVLHEGADRRIGLLDRMWSRAIVGLRYVDEDGDRRRDQGEGHFQFVRPYSLALFVGKLGEPGLILGSDGRRFWWLELLDDRRAVIGNTATGAAASLETIGVPILPGDLLLALDVVPWPEPGAGGATRVVGVDWSGFAGVDASRTAAVTFADADRRWTVHADVFTREPMAVQVWTADGRLVCESLLSGHQRVLNRMGLAVEQRMPGRAVIDVPGADATIDLTINDPESSERRPRAAVFDLEELLRRFRIDEVRLLDDAGTGLGEPSA